MPFRPSKMQRSMFVSVCRVCDHDYDCGSGDLSDESGDCGESCQSAFEPHCMRWIGLASRPCPDGKFKCASGHCVSNTSRCDGYPQCADVSDEIGCPARFPNGQFCPADRFTCNNTLCINQNWVCDGGESYRFYLCLSLDSTRLFLISHPTRQRLSR